MAHWYSDVSQILAGSAQVTAADAQSIADWTQGKESMAHCGNFSAATAQFMLASAHRRPTAAQLHDPCVHELLPGRQESEDLGAQAYAAESHDPPAEAQRAETKDTAGVFFTAATQEVEASAQAREASAQSWEARCSTSISVFESVNFIIPIFLLNSEICVRPLNSEASP